MDYEELLNMTAELGCQLMFSGAEIYRVEESMRRLLNAYRLGTAEVFAIPSCIIVSVTTPEGRSITRMRRIGGHGTDLERLERCNALCRRLCAETPPLEEAHALLSALPEWSRQYASWQALLGYGIAPAFFAPLFGGGLSDALCAFAVGLAIGACQLYGRSLIGSNGFFRTAICSAIASLLSLLLVHWGFGGSVDTVTISALMMLVPGVALTNAMREIMVGDTISALSHIADAILIGVAIALGAAVGLAAGRPELAEAAAGTIVSTYVVPCVCAFLACFGFAVVFNIRGPGIPIACFGGALGWLAYLLSGGTVWAAFLAAAVIGVFSEVAARLRRCPVTGYVLIALLPLVPGGGIYRAMRYCIDGNTPMFLSTLIQTFAMAAALAIGSMLASSLFRALYARFRRGGTRKTI